VDVCDIDILIWEYFSRRMICFCMGWCLKSVDLQLGGFSESRFGEPLTNVFTLVTLKLQDLSVFWMLYNGSVTGKFLLASPDNLFQIVLRRQALHSCQCLTSVTLLDPYMHETILYSFLRALDCISKGVKCFSDFQYSTWLGKPPKYKRLVVVRALPKTIIALIFVLTGCWVV